MSYTVILLIAAGIILYTGQGFFNKLFSVSHPADASQASPVFCVIYGAVVALSTFIFSGLRIAPDGLTLLFGVVNGFALFFYNYSAIHAAKSGPYTLQSMMSSFGNILIPLMVSLFAWGEQISLVKGSGIVCMMLAFFVYNGGKINRSDIASSGFIWFVMVFLANGVYSLLNAAQQRYEAGAFRSDMIIITFLTAAVISGIYIMIPGNRTAVRAFHMPVKAAVFAIASSLCAAAAINMLMLTLSYVPAAILYPIEAGGILIASTLLSRAVLGETICLHKCIGIAAAVAGLVFTNI